MSYWIPSVKQGVAVQDRYRNAHGQAQSLRAIPQLTALDLATNFDGCIHHNIQPAHLHKTSLIVLF